MHTFSALSFLGDQADIHRPCAVVRDHGACHILVDNTLSIQAVETAISGGLAAGFSFYLLVQLSSNNHPGKKADDCGTRLRKIFSQKYREINDKTSCSTVNLVKSSTIKNSASIRSSVLLLAGDRIRV